ncbi:uncharacterized protein SOCE836_027070 [Sorangium cellulosum]|uniref:Uncharacterized protein n=1 Tax=Sorangium cellulosum TaxID=56 RepID=A0A4P2QLB6_SORCE|nr:uncharacterized protein SOCE836_027070 [Sorangium cellulosum]WCQ89992.1 hypothetical protein NQZ70_02691 [Sorangium sp. Soce836]
MPPMSRAPVDAPAETAAELPTATEATLLEMVLGLPGVGPRILGTPLSPPSVASRPRRSLAERTQIALFDATRLAAAFELGRRYHAARARRGALHTDAARVARHFGPRLASLVHEELWIAALDTHGRVRETRLLARGDGARERRSRGRAVGATQPLRRPRREDCDERTRSGRRQPAGLGSVARSLSSGITAVVQWVRSPTPMQDRQAERTAAEPSDAEKSWDQRILERVPSGVDASLIAENLRLTPTERVERMRKALEFIEEAKAAHGHRFSARR